MLNPKLDINYFINNIRRRVIDNIALLHIDWKTNTNKKELRINIDTIHMSEPEFMNDIISELYITECEFINECISNKVEYIHMPHIGVFRSLRIGQQIKDFLTQYRSVLSYEETSKTIHNMLETYYKEKELYNTVRVGTLIYNGKSTSNSKINA